MQNFKRNEEIEFHDYLQSLAMASKKNGESPTKANTIPTREKECIEVQASQSRAKTKEKAKDIARIFVRTSIASTLKKAEAEQKQQLERKEKLVEA